MLLPLLVDGVPVPFPSASPNSTSHRASVVTLRVLGHAVMLFNVGGRMVRVGASLWCHPISGRKQKQPQLVKTSFFIVKSVVCWSQPLIVQGGGHGVQCGTDGLGAVPYEEQLSESLFGTLSCKAGLCILVPAVLHRLF